MRGRASQSSLLDLDLSFSALASPFSSSSILDSTILMEDFFSDSEVHDLREPLAVFSGTNLPVSGRYLDLWTSSQANKMSSIFSGGMSMAS